MSAEKKKKGLIQISFRSTPDIVERAHLARLRLGPGTTMQSVLNKVLDDGLPDLRIVDVKKVRASE